MEDSFYILCFCYFLPQETKSQALSTLCLENYVMDFLLFFENAWDNNEDYVFVRNCLYRRNF